MAVEPVPDHPSRAGTRLYEQLLRGMEIEEIPSPSPLIEGVLDFDSIAALYGPAGSGKSFVALDWALCIATGIPWHNHAVIRAPVLYVVGEGVSGMAARFIAWREHHEISAIENIFWAPRAPNLLSEQGRDELAEVVAKTQPALTLLDTIARHIPGGDENAFLTMSQVVEVLDAIRVETGGCAVGIHHTGKDEDAGSRGHSSLKGAMDTEICCSKGPLLTATKQKNHADGHIIGSFELTPSPNDSMYLTPKARRTNHNDELVTRALGNLSGEASYNDLRAAAVSLGLPFGSFPRTLDRLLQVSILHRDTTDTGTRYRWA